MRSLPVQVVCLYAGPLGESLCVSLVVSDLLRFDCFLLHLTVCHHKILELLSQFFFQTHYLSRPRKFTFSCDTTGPVAEDKAKNRG